MKMVGCKQIEFWKKLMMSFRTKSSLAMRQLPIDKIVEFGDQKVTEKIILNINSLVQIFVSGVD